MLASWPVEQRLGTELWAATAMGGRAAAIITTRQEACHTASSTHPARLELEHDEQFAGLCAEEWSELQRAGTHMTEQQTS